MLGMRSIGEIAFAENSELDESFRYKEQKYGLVLTGTGNSSANYKRFKSQHIYRPEEKAPYPEQKVISFEDYSRKFD